MGSLHNIDFGVFWASWGREGTGFRELVWGFDGFRQVLRFQGYPMHCQLVPGSEGCVFEVSKVSVLDGF